MGRADNKASDQEINQQPVNKQRPGVKKKPMGKTQDF
jgi:hypothetical protein